MSSNGFSDNWTDTSDQVENARWHASGVDDLGEHERIDRSNFRWLDNNRVASGHRRRNLQSDLMQRIVPGGNTSHDAKWLTNDK